MNGSFRATLCALVLAASFFAVPVLGQTPCASYRVVCQTVYEQQKVTAYRLGYETVLEERQVTRHRPVWETHTRERRYRVAKPVYETSTREERYKVLRPVTQTETRYRQHVVRRPVTETVMQDRSYVTCEPITTLRTQYVDRGGFVDQTVFRPGAVRNGLRWVPGGYVSDPATGTNVWYRGGLHWVPTQAPGRYEVRRQYVPNVVGEQVPQTSYQQRVVTQKVPVNVTRYVDEVVNQPVQVQVCKWVEQEYVRPVTVTTQRIEYEERVEPVHVRVCRMQAEVQTVQVPHTVAKWIPYTSTRLVPRTVTMRVPVDPCGDSVSIAPARVAPAPSSGGATAPADIAPSLDVAPPTEDDAARGAGDPSVRVRRSPAPAADL